jgi:hypothetical protein
MRRIIVCHLLQFSGLDEENLPVQKPAPDKNNDMEVVVCRGIQRITKDIILLYFLLLY